MISDEQLISAIALSKISGVGDVIAKSLVSYCGGVEQIFKKKKSQLLKVPGVGPVIAENILAFDDFKIAEKEIQFLHKHKIEALFFTEEKYPHTLKQVPDSPILIYVKGNIDLNEGRFISIVGTRNATEYFLL